MQINRDPTSAHYLIKRYSAEAITINNVDYHQSLIINADILITDWRPQVLADLGPEDFTRILALKPAIVLLGVGEQHQFPDPQLFQSFYQQHIGVEIMTTGAACRTFNLLVSEGRGVVAALLR